MLSYKERMRAAFIKKVRAAGLCDERNAAFCASSRKGLVLLAVKGNILTVSEIDAQHVIGSCIERIPLKEITDLRVKTGFFSALFAGDPISFTWNGEKYAFSNVIITGAVKDSMDVIREESEKKA